MTTPTPETKSPRFVSMRLVISLATAGIVSMTVIGAGWLVEQSTRQALHHEIESRLLLEARNLALVSSKALLSEYPSSRCFPCSTEMKERRTDLALAFVLDHEGVIKGHANARMLGSTESGMERFHQMPTSLDLRQGEGMFGDDELLLASVRVEHSDGQPLGTAVVGLRQGYVNGILASTRHKVFLFTAVMVLAGLISAVALVSFLLRPIGVLRRGLERIGTGDLDTRISLRQRTELGVLADTINDVTARLKQSKLESLAKEQEIIDTQKEVIQTLGEVVESRSKETGNHILRVGKASRQLALLAGASREESELIELASPMHDVGKVAIPDSILNKPGKLTKDEFEIVKTHTTIGYDLLRGSDRPIMRAAAVIAHEHHEKWDGSGYPRGLRGEQIHTYGRVVALVDVFDALRSRRAYKASLPIEEVVQVLQQGSGRHFDPRLVDVFVQHLSVFEDIFSRHQDEVPDKSAKAA